MIEYVHRHRVRYRECDPMGVVYHAHYVDYFEVARTEALRSVGLPYRAIEDSGIIMPVVDLQVKYHRPARYDDMLSVITRFSRMPDVRVPIEYEVRNTDSDELVATGHVTLCFVDQASGRPVRAPQTVIEAFERASIVLSGS